MATPRLRNPVDAGLRLPRHPSPLTSPGEPMLSPLFALILMQAPTVVPTLEPGAVVRVVAPQVAAAPIVGRVQIADGDGLWIEALAGAGPGRVPWAAVTAPEGRHRRGGLA